MGRCAFTAILLLLVLLFAPSSVPQAAGASASGSDVDQNSPEALEAAYDQAMKATNWASAIADAQRLVAMTDSAAHLILLAEAQIASGANTDALATSDRALDASKKNKASEDEPESALRDEKARIYLIRGNALLRLRRDREAIDSYSRSAALASSPGAPLFNICVAYSDSGDPADALPACRKAAQADPSRADAWFQLGTLLYADAQTDANGKLLISAECRQALEKYLDLAPDGVHAAETRAMLEAAP